MVTDQVTMSSETFVMEQCITPILYAGFPLIGYRSVYIHVHVYGAGTGKFVYVCVLDAAFFVL